MFNFEKLDVWHKAIELADAVYSVTKAFPSDERFGLTNQMRRAAVSISSNIAEGTSRSSRGDYARFVELATGWLPLRGRFPVSNFQAARFPLQGRFRPPLHRCRRAKPDVKRPPT
jgi:hypothetical protein